MSDPLPKPQSIAEAVEEELGFLRLLRSLHRKVDALGDLKFEVGELTRGVLELRQELMAVSRGQTSVRQRIASQAMQLGVMNDGFERVVNAATVQGLTIDRVEKKLDRLLGALTVPVDPDPTPPREGAPP